MKTSTILDFLKNNLMWVLIALSTLLLILLQILLYQDDTTQIAQNPEHSPIVYSSPTPNFTTTVEQIYANANLTLTAIYSQSTPQATPALPDSLNSTPSADETAPAVSVEEAQSNNQQAPPGATHTQAAATPANLPAATTLPTATGSPAASTQTNQQPSTPTETLPPLPTATSAACSYQTNEAYQTTLLVLINELRAGSGLPQLTRNDTLQNVAFAHSEDMACRDFYDHIGSNGADFVMRLQSAGFTFARATELLYVGRGELNSPQRAFQAWLDGPSSFHQLTYPAYNQVGIGYVNKDDSSYGGYFTLVLAAVQP